MSNESKEREPKVIWVEVTAVNEFELLKGFRLVFQYRIKVPIMAYKE